MYTTHREVKGIYDSLQGILCKNTMLERNKIEGNKIEGNTLLLI